MIRGLGVLNTLTYSQTLNGRDKNGCLAEPFLRINKALVGHFW